VQSPDPLRRPLKLAASTQLACGALLFLCLAWDQPQPPDFFFVALELTVVLLIVSGTAVLVLRPVSWWIALVVQLPLLAHHVWVLIDTARGFALYQATQDPYYFEPEIGYVILLGLGPLVLALCCCTITLYLLRPRTREQYGLSARQPRVGGR
jgi:hypothetical protein